MFFVLGSPQRSKLDWHLGLSPTQDMGAIDPTTIGGQGVLPGFMADVNLDNEEYARSEAYPAAAQELHLLSGKIRILMIYI